MTKDNTSPGPSGESPTIRRGGTLALKGLDGQPMGVDLEIGPATKVEDDETGRKALASRIKSWKPFLLDGETVEYSPAAALSLVNRFSHVREQLAEATETKL